MKKIMIFFLLCVCVMIPQIVFAAQTQIQVEIDTRPVELSYEPVMENKELLVPIRDVMEKIKADVLWNENDKRVAISFDGNNIVFELNSKVATVNGINQTINVVPRIIKGKIMVPLKFTCDSLNIASVWDEEAQIMHCYAPKYQVYGRDGYTTVGYFGQIDINTEKDDFAEIERFLDSKSKNFSSIMGFKREIQKNEDGTEMITYKSETVPNSMVTVIAQNNNVAEIIDETAEKRITSYNKEMQSQKGEGYQQVISDNFDLKLYTNKTSYKNKDLIMCKTELEYIGARNMIKVMNGVPEVIISIKKDKDFIYELDRNDIAINTVWKKGEIHQRDFVDIVADNTIEKPYYDEKNNVLKLNAGDYTITAEYSHFYDDRYPQESGMIQTVTRKITIY